MYSGEINNILKLHQGFWGCYDIKSLQKTFSPFSKGWLIIHCKEHWLGLYSFGDGNVLLFDPLGPNEKQHDVMMVLKKIVKRVYFNKVKVQSDTSIQCGLFCIGFVLSNIDCLICFQQFLSLFHTFNFYLNDALIRCLVNKLR